MISVVIPTFNEEAYIKATIKYLWKSDVCGIISEIIISDGGSSDNTIAIADTEGASTVVSPAKGRAMQMNYGATVAKGEILYFLHADTVPPQNFSADIKQLVDNGTHAGCFMLSFDYNHWFLKANCWFTRFDVNAIRFGDQSLFVTKKLFLRVGGFSEKHIVLEDQDIIKRLKQFGRFRVIRKPVITSARKYVENGIYKTQAIFFLIYFMYRLGFSQQKLLSTYRKMISQDKH